MTPDGADRDFQELRARIDALDAALVDQLIARRALAAEAGARKRAAGQPVVDAERERAILARVQERAAGRLPAEELAAIYTEILRMTRAAAQGPGDPAGELAGR